VRIDKSDEVITERRSRTRDVDVITRRPSARQHGQWKIVRATLTHMCTKLNSYKHITQRDTQHDALVSAKPVY